jgi:sigma-B regulation protein RsbQ
MTDVDSGVFATSADGAQIYFESTGDAATTLVCVHGWLGNVRWWDGVRDAFSSTHRVVALDLAGHGTSTKREHHSAARYAQDMVAVIRAVATERVVLVAHSMAGAYALLACPQLDNVDKLVLVDTVKNLDAVTPPEQVDSMLAMYRADYANAVANILPKFLFAPTSPPAVVERLTREFSSVTGDYAASLLEPLYRFDHRAAAREVRVPARGIGTDLHRGNPEANRKYLRDYDYVELEGCGHYPMLEAPDAFNAALRAA